jgi:hypothetical protein
MKAFLLLFVAATLATPAHGAPSAKTGKALHDKTCTSCHIGMFGGDGSAIYTRSDRKVRTAQQLAARIAGCNANTGAGWFPEDEAHVGAYLNQQYYKFK